MPYVAGPFLNAHLYVQFGGKLPGAEEWSCGFRLSNVGAAQDAAVAAPTIQAAIAPIISTFHAASLASQRALLSFVKVNAIGTDGRYVLQTTNEAVLADIPGGGNPSTTPANQIAVAVSLTTGFSRGPAHRGRFYLPLPAVTVDADGRISAVMAGIYDTAATALLADVNAISASWKMAVFSRKLGSPAVRNVTGIEVGRVLDTQRRRRRSLVEAYV